MHTRTELPSHAPPGDAIKIGRAAPRRTPPGAARLQSGDRGKHFGVVGTRDSSGHGGPRTCRAAERLRSQASIPETRTPWSHAPRCADHLSSFAHNNWRPETVPAPFGERTLETRKHGNPNIAGGTPSQGARPPQGVHPSQGIHRPMG